MNASSPFRGHLAALFTITVWAVTFINTKLLLVDFSAVEIMFFRLVFAVAALTIASPPRAALPTSPRAEWRYAAAGLCGVTLYFLFQNTALTYTLAANVSVLVSVAPLFTALLAAAVFREKLRPGFFLGFAAAMAGIVLIAFNGSVVLKLNPLGDLLSILAAASWAGYSVLIKHIGARGEPVLAVTRKVFTWGFLLMLPVLPFAGFRLGLARLAGLPNLLNLLFLGVVASAVCYVTWNYALSHLGPVRASVYIYAIPLITIAASALFLREPVTLPAAVGMVLILAGMALSESGKVG